MKLVRYRYEKEVRWGKTDKDEVIPLKEAPFNKIKPTSESIPIEKCVLLPPAVPSKIVLVGLNYKDHARELNMKIPKEPVIFLKPPTSLSGPGDSIFYPPGVKKLDYEAELALVVGRKAKNVSSKDASKYILGYTCLNDVTARDIQAKDGQWTRAKSFDTFCPVGPWVIPKLNTSNLKIQLYLNGKLKQNSSSSSFIFSIEYIVSFISKVMTLLPGDIISTGTPPGVGKMDKGDVVEVKISGIGVLRNHVV